MTKCKKCSREAENSNICEDCIQFLFEEEQEYYAAGTGFFEKAMPLQFEEAKKYIENLKKEGLTEK